MRTTISLPDELAELVRVEARRRGISFSAIVRESLENTLREPPKLPWQGIVSVPELAAHALDGALAESWAEDIAGNV
ncbi:MAG: ribbon-helix-helix domain-containing protein [Gammaproteobacteria bacterium]|nr:ribbon-helix-helix domain-containing protein [Gammaproteobacteria bacterium]